MTRSDLNYTHGDTGVEPGVSLDFTKGERPKAEQFDWYWYEVTQSIAGHADEFDRLDSNDDGIVDEADSLTAGGNLKGDLNTVDGETIWNESGGYIPQSNLQNTSVTVAGNTVDLGDSTAISIGDLSNIDATGEGADNGLNADLLDGQHADDLGVGIEDSGTEIVAPATAVDFTGHLSITDDGDGTVTIDPTHNHDGRYARLYDGIQAPKFATTADVPDTITEGEFVYIEEDSSLYVEDGT